MVPDQQRIEIPLKGQSFCTSMDDNKYREWSLQETIKNRIKELDDDQISLDYMSQNSYSMLYTLDYALSHPEIIAPDLLAAYTVRLTNVMENAGAAPYFLDLLGEVIDYYQKNNQNATNLYITTVEYLRFFETASRKKEQALANARESARNLEDTIKVDLEIIQYYIDASQYSESKQLCDTVINIIENNEKYKVFLPQVLSRKGIIYYYLFNYKKAKAIFEIICNQNPLIDEHVYGEAQHYLGRIADDLGNFSVAIQFYIEGNKHQRKNLADTAWYHLRLGNALIKLNLINQAIDHIQWSQELFGRIGYNGSPLVHIDLAWADIYRAQNDYKKAERQIAIALNHAKRIGFYRGELLCNVNLFWLQFRDLHRVDKAIITFINAMTNREIWKNNGVGLISMYLRRILLSPAKRIFRKHQLFPAIAINSPSQAALTSCSCDIHQSPQKNN